MRSVRVLRGAITGLALLVMALPARAQDAGESCLVTLGHSDIVSPSADLARLFDLADSASRQSFFLRRTSDRMQFNACGVPRHVARLARALALPELPERGASLLPAGLRVHLNTGYPRDWNDGALWSGRGAASSLTAGAMFRWGVLEAALAPVFIALQNSAFDMLPYPDPAYSRYIHRWHGRFIDLPQRFGPDAATAVDPGQSYIRVQHRAWRGGFSTENLAWGAGLRNPLLLSGTAAGFPHVFLESARPVDIGIGHAELQLFWGRLSESDHFDRDPDNDHRAMGGIMGVIRPRGLDGLYLGVAHLHTQTWSPETDAIDILTAPVRGAGVDSAGLPRNLRLFGLFARWAGVPGGFEVYGEWARQDTWEQWVRLLNPVDAAQAYTLGLQKLVRRGDGAVRFSAEVSHLSDALAHRDLGRGLITYYVSPQVTQGHTHRGQLLGAPIGPGSEAQFIGADVFWSGGRSSFSIERVRYDDDAYYAVWGAVHGPHGHDTEMSFRAGHLWGSGSFAVEGEVGYSFRYNRSLLGLHHGNSPDFPYRRDENIGLRLHGRWTPPVRIWPL
ncbi:MAG TPA: hypothetical protein VFZ24_00965 [Longimicrobiales bacterium]